MPRAGMPWHPAERPLVVAHRGSSKVHPEHTFAGYEQAIAEGADLLECDVRLTADGYLVCVHDRRIDRTSDGRGVVSAKTLDQLRRWDFGAGSVLRLEDLMELALGADRPVGLAIETKHPNRYAGLVEQRVVEAVRAFGMMPSRFEADSRVYFMSFAELALRRWREMAPGAPTVFLMERVPLRCRRGGCRSPRGRPGRRSRSSVSTRSTCAGCIVSVAGSSCGRSTSRRTSICAGNCRWMPSSRTVPGWRAVTSTGPEPGCADSVGHESGAHGNRCDTRCDLTHKGVFDLYGSWDAC